MREIPPDKQVYNEALKKLSDENKRLEEEIEKKVQENDSLTQEVNRLRKEAGTTLARDLGRVTLEQFDLPSETSSSLIVLDPIHGSIVLDRIMLSLIRQPLLQRLNSVKQLSFSYQDHPNATHSRLAHSLGVSRLAELALSSMINKDEIYVFGTKQKETFSLTRDERNELVTIAKVASLLHDVGHGPLGHALDRYVQYKKWNTLVPGVKADKFYSSQYAQKYLDSMLKSFNIDSQLVASILNPSQWEFLKDKKYYSLVASIINGELDIDRMDYLSRDSLFTGLPLASLNPFPLIDSMRPIKREGFYSVAFDPQQMPLLEYAISGRQLMYSYCYETDGKIAFETMLIFALKDFETYQPDISLDDIMLLRDDELLTLMVLAAPKKSAARQLSLYIKEGQVFVPIFKELLNPSGRVKRPIRILDNYYNELTSYKGRDYLVKQTSTPEEWRQILSESLPEEEKWKVLVYVTPRELFENPEATVPILTQDKEGNYDVRPIIEMSDTIKETVRIWVNQRQNLRVFVDPTLPSESKEWIRKKCSKDLFVPQTN